MKRFLGALFALSCGFAACFSSPKQVYSFDAKLMHTRWDFSLVSRSEAGAKLAFEQASREIERLDKALAMWRPDSEVAAFNENAGKGPQKVSPDLDAVLSLGLAVSGFSEGASDCTVGRLVQLWYDSLQKGSLPPPKAVREALATVDWKRAKREGEGLWSIPSGTRVDLGSLAKGYAQDKAAALLGKQGIKAFLMNAGGQVYAAGRKPDGGRWKVGILHPRKSGELAGMMELEDQCMSTSGDYEQAGFVKGRRYSHIMDPRTGMPITNGMASATVVLKIRAAAAPGPASWCDALDTAAMVLGLEKGMSLLRSQKALGLLLREKAGGGLDFDCSPELKAKIQLSL